MRIETLRVVVGHQSEVDQRRGPEVGSGYPVVVPVENTVAVVIHRGEDLPQEERLPVGHLLDHGHRQLEGSLALSLVSVDQGRGEGCFGQVGASFAVGIEGREHVVHVERELVEHPRVVGPEGHGRPGEPRRRTAGS